MYEKRVLPNGVTLALERVEGVRSVSMGVWIRAGSRCELDGERGAAHFIEHMLFKGTASLTSAALAERMDALGAEFNAYTSRDCTSYYVRCLDVRAREAAGLLADMLTEPRFDAGDMDTERGVILDEIRMYDDMPDDAANELLVKSCFPGSLGLPVLGTRGSVAGMAREILLAFREREYVPGNIVLAAAGSFSESDIAPLAAALAALPARPAREPERSEYAPAVALERRDTEQNQLLLAFPGVTYEAERCTLGIMLSILGGSASSRLYRRLRDESGLCYDLECFDMTWADTGLVGVATALAPENERAAIAAICSELRRFLDEGPGEAELERARAQAESGIVLSLESTLARMRRMGQNELFLRRERGVEELLERCAAVTRGDVLELARRVFDFGRLSAAALGDPLDEEEYLGLRSL